MSVNQYSLNFTKYAPSLMSNSRDEMSSFIMGVSVDVVEEFRLAMLHGQIDISKLMIHSERVEETRLKR